MSGFPYRRYHLQGLLNALYAIFRCFEEEAWVHDRMLHIEEGGVVPAEDLPPVTW